MLVKSIEFLATLGPIGKKCPAPGTFGSFAGVLAVLSGVFWRYVCAILLGFGGKNRGNPEGKTDLIIFLNFVNP